MYTTDERICTVKSPFGDDALLLSHMAGHEALSSLFCFRCELLSDKPDLDFEKIIGKSLTLEVKLVGGKLRHFNGVVSRFAQGASQGRFTAYSAEIVPWLWLLTRSTNCRIFQDKTVPEIVEAVFRDHGLSDFEMHVGSHEPHHYCVQYRETDFSFVTRLLEEAGIGYYFKHSDKAHTLALFDSPSGNGPCPNQAKATYSRTAAGAEAVGDVEGWHIEREFRSGACAHTDYNFEDPNMSLMATTTTSLKVGGNENFERYDYPGDHQALADGESRIKRRMEAHEAIATIVRAESSCADFSPGFKFDLKGHPRFDDSYLICDVSHTITQDMGETSGEDAKYWNSFSCMPHSIPYRPLQLTPRPVISGVQTATVVGASGEEIDVDEHGRVVVKFHWDRSDARDETSSCRIRVAHHWAGKNWGMVIHPRIGQEVIVDFLEGDPDRPIIVGRVYNGEQKPPYSLPGSKTQSGWKSRSTLNGGADNFNEIRFEDKKGSEELFMQAEKDLNRTVKNNESDSVGNDRSRSVGHDETLDVSNDRTRTVGNNESVTIGVNRTDSVGADETLSVGSNRSRSVGASETVTVALQRTHTVGINETISVGAAQEVTVGAMRALTVGANQDTNVGVNHSVSVGSNQDISIGADRSLSVDGNLTESVKKDYSHKTDKKISIEAGDEITIKTGKAKIVMKKNGDITIEGKTINIKGSGNIVMKAKKILEN